MVLASVVCLALGFIAGPFPLVWGALVLSLTGLALVVLKTQRQRRATLATEKVDHQTEGGGENGARTARSAALGSGDTQAPVERTGAEMRGVRSRAAPSELDLSTTMSGVHSGAKDADEVSEIGRSTDKTVLVIPGRRRFHRKGCRLLAGRASDEIGVAEALDEGFSACSACIEDGVAFRSAP
jgi:heme exporter protein D